MQSDIEQGKMLQRTLDAPVSIMDAVTCLDRKWRETNELAKAKHDRLKVSRLRHCAIFKIHCGFLFVY